MLCRMVLVPLMAVFLAGSSAALRADAAGVVIRQPSLPAFEPLPLGAIKPAGWLKEQLQIQADGLSGHLDEFWPDIKDSAWFGGKAEGWERVPYWLDGLVPLAYLLDDDRLKLKVKTALDYILDHQQPDGWLGPVGDSQKHKPYDVWPLFPLFKALTQYQEATGDPRVVPALLKCCRKIDQVIAASQCIAGPASARPIWPSPSTGCTTAPASPGSSTWPGRRLPRVTIGPPSFVTSSSPAKTQGKFELDTHGVNTGMGLKYGGVRYRLSGDSERQGCGLPHARPARSIPRSGHRHLHLRRAPGRPQPVAGDRALHGRRGDVLARGARRHSG